MKALRPGDVTSLGFRGCSLSPSCPWEVKELRCRCFVKAPSGRSFLMVWALDNEKGPPCSHPHFCQPCPHWRAPPAPSYLGAGAHVCLFFPVLHFALLCSLPRSCVCSWSSLHTYCRRPRVYSSSGLNITFAITRGILTCQSLSRVCANSSAARRLGVPTSVAFIPGEFSFRWKPSPKTRMAGFRKKSVLGPRRPSCSVSCVQKAQVSTS